jgi:hypothetical protein
MRNDKMLLASTLTQCPIIKRQRDRMRWRGIIVALALEAFVATAIVGVLWFVCFGVVTK